MPCTDTIAAQRDGELLYVKWETPIQELQSTARLAEAFVHRRIAQPNQVCLAVPNRTWARQMRLTCQQQGVSTCMLLPVQASAQVQAVLARLDVIADVPGALDAWSLLGGDAHEARQLQQRHAASRGHTVLHAAKAHEVPELQDALEHVTGAEDAAQAAALLRRQMARPSIPQGAQRISIAHYQNLPKQFDFLFVVGCVDGLVPGRDAFENADDEARCQAMDVARAAWKRIVEHPGTRTVLSSFTKIDVQTADALGIRYARTKTERGEQVAIARPSMLLSEQGQKRPTTEGGQALLKKYRLI